MSSSSARTREERLESSVFTGSQLTDMQILAEADDETFNSLCNTNLRLKDICTNPRYEQQLYEMRVLARFSEYHHLFDEDWGLELTEDQLAKVIKPTWKTIYQNLSKMKRVQILRLLDGSKPLSYMTSYDEENYGVRLEAVMGAYPDIFKFVYPVNPDPFFSVNYYANSRWVSWPSQWREVLGVLRWLLDLDEVEPTEALLRNAVRVGYGPFIRYLVAERRLPLDVITALTGISNGAGDILDLVLGLEESIYFQLSLRAGINRALFLGNIEGLEGFHSLGMRLKDEDIVINLYPKETIKWLRDHGYEYASSPKFRL